MEYTASGEEVWGRRRARALNRRRQAGARPERRRETPSKEKTVELLPYANERVGGGGVSH